MKRMWTCLVSAGLLAALFVGMNWWELPTRQEVHAAQAGQSGAAPVESDMHEFMEYVFQPTYLRLKEQMAKEPADNQAWKAIKSDGLILAESGNLLLMRKSEEDPADWMRHSTKVREAGGQLYAAAKAKDYRTARQHYETMLTNCNACHDQFAGGEHQLEP